MQLSVLRWFFKWLGTLSPALGARAGVRVFYKPRRFPTPNWEKAAAEASHPARLGWKNGQQLAARTWGSDGPTVLLVHGWEGRATQLGKIAVALSVRGYRVVAFDGPAHGQPQQERTTLVEFADAVKRAVDQFGPIDAIVGHSFGAAASCIAVQKGAAVKRLVLISCPFSIRNVVSRFAQFLSIPDRAHEKMYPIMERLHACSEHDLSFVTIGPELQLPCLLIHDTDDKYVPLSDGHAVAERIAGAKLVETSGLGHLRILQDGSVVARVCGYLGDAAARRSLEQNGEPSREYAEQRSAARHAAR